MVRVSDSRARDEFVFVSAAFFHSMLDLHGG